MLLCERQKPSEAGRIQEGSARKNHQWRSIFRPGYQDVGVAEARIDLRALVFDAEPGERAVVERQDLASPPELL